jgi:phosphoglycerate kinase
MAVKYIDQIEMKDQRVMIRVDYNVPYDKEMNITDDTRISATIPTIDFCLKSGAKIILVSHLGRPKGQVKQSLSLRPVAKRLSDILKKPVRFIDTPLGEETIEITKTMNNGDIILFENIRFYPGEEKNDRALGELIAQHADIFINDAFAAAHRGHSSNFAVTEFMKTVAADFT